MGGTLLINAGILLTLDLLIPSSYTRKHLDLPSSRVTPMDTCPGLRLPRLPRLSQPGIRLKQSRPACHCEARPPAKPARHSPEAKPMADGRSEADRARAGRWRTARAMAGRGGVLNTRHSASRTAAFRHAQPRQLSSRLNGTYPNDHNYTIHPPATRLPTPEIAFSLCAGISGNGGQGARHSGQVKC